MLVVLWVIAAVGGCCKGVGQRCTEIQLLQRQDDPADWCFGVLLALSTKTILLWTGRV